jgi:3-mercaptopyruvate sulfurtransferase SseA
MGMEKISHIDSGFNGWKDAGLPIVDYETRKDQ